ncbi:MAG: xanthine dehydrogenase accessory protein XdhC [Rhodobacteraceae bacterium]|nr:xanthine dehydrogenase accessory protein XdhC [Paracoccaceae bacterium]
MFDLGALRVAVAAQGRVARIVIAAHDGSSPRETGAAMLVWEDGQQGTIGGGALEWEATQRARTMLAAGGMRLDRQALGPSLGQCCGGAVTVLTEVYDAEAVARLDGAVIARPVSGPAGEMPLAVARQLNRARAEGVAPLPRLVQGWMVEPVAAPSRALWVWGAGHVGRAIVAVLAPLPDLAITWIDVAEARFPLASEGVTRLWAENPADLVAQAPRGAEHLVLTYSHALDLELCHRLLQHGFGRLGLIGSETKAARFRSRLRALGHTPERIATIQCPIGERDLGKHPQAIAIGVAADFIRQKSATASQKESAT